VRTDQIDEVTAALVKRYGQEAVDQATQNVQRLLDKADIYIRVFDAEVLEQIINSGRFKPSGELALDALQAEGFDVPKGRNPVSKALSDYSDDITEELYDRLDYQERRDSQEEFMFGKAINERPPDQRPIYGFLADTSDLSDASHSGVASYGSVVVKLRSDVKDRATALGQDSFANGLPVPVNDYSIAGALESAAIRGGAVAEAPRTQAIIEGAGQAQSIGELNKAVAGSFTEAQIHGQVRATDIAELTFTKGAKPSPAIVQWAEQNGVIILLKD
jgi:hypothetical protein